MTKLHAELQRHLTENKFFGTVLDHPLVRIFPYGLKHPKGFRYRDAATMANAMYSKKKATLLAAKRERDWHSYVFLHERPYRCEALHYLNNSENLKVTEFWPLVRVTWMDSENIRQWHDEWVELWTESRRYSTSVMQRSDQKRFRALSENITVWRGVNHPDGANGLSWTVDRDKAVWFARRFKSGKKNAGPHLAKGIVSKKVVLAYFNGRNESEIVVLPENVKHFSMEHIPI